MILPIVYYVHFLINLRVVSVWALAEIRLCKMVRNVMMETQCSEMGVMLTVWLSPTIIATKEQFQGR